MKIENMTAEWFKDIIETVIKALKQIIDFITANKLSSHYAFEEEENE